MQTQKDDNAFPIFDGDGAHEFDRSGLTKREYFAALALQGLLANSQLRAGIAVVPISIKVADELIYLLNQTDNGK